MTYLIRAIIRALVAPRHRLSCPKSLWGQGLKELRRRGEEEHESGAFLLGFQARNRRVVTDFLYYDDLDPHCLDSGYVIIDGRFYGDLWRYCREAKLDVVGDIHTHPGLAIQSLTDKMNPMISTPGHIAIIVPEFAARSIKKADLGIYEYLGAHQWNDFSGSKANAFFHIGV